MDVFGFSVPLWIVLAITAFLLYIIFMSRQFLTFKLQGIPGPFPFPVIGSMPAINKLGVHGFDVQCTRKYGKVFGYCGGFMPLNIVVGDKEILRQILVKEFANFPNRMVLKGLNGDLEDGLMFLEDDHWRHVRNKITPTFSTGKLRKMAAYVEEASNTLIKNLKQKVRKAENGELEMYSIFGGFAMDVICSTAFGIQVDSQNSPTDEFVDNAKRFLKFSFSSPKLLALMFIPYARNIMAAFGISIAATDVQDFFRKVTTRLLNERKAGNKDLVDFLQIMKNAQVGQDSDDEGDDNEDGSNIRNTSSWTRKGITFNEILANAELFFLAGYETTSIALSLCSYLLALHPDCQDKIRQEMDETIGYEKLTYENIWKLQYLEMCLNETLRLFPPAARTDRHCTRDTEINGVKFKAGINVKVPIYSIHHDPDYWDDPEKFMPERFAPDHKANIDPITFLPFGYGPRNCVGMRLALLEAKMALACLFCNFKISVCRKTHIPPTLEKIEIGLLRPDSCWLKLEEIN